MKTRKGIIAAAFLSVFIIGLSVLFAQDPKILEVDSTWTFATDSVSFSRECFIMHSTKEDSIVEAEYRKKYSYDHETSLIMSCSATQERQYQRFFGFLKELMETDSLKTCKMMERYALSYTDKEGNVFGYGSKKHR
jgi:hypothetical protein